MHVHSVTDGKRSCLVVVLLAAVFMSGCASIKEIANLRHVQFGIDALSHVELAGVDVTGVRNYDDLRATDLLRLGSAIARNEMPARLVLDIGAYNPESNGIQARLVRMDWMLLLQDRETVSGIFEQEVLIPAGETRQFPIAIQLDLVRFFDNNLRDLVNVALSLSGEGGEATNVKVRATPTIRTAIGDIRYPEPITIVNATVGGT